MIKWLKRIFFGRDLKDVLEETRTVFVHGVKFRIRKIDPIAHLEGAKVMRPAFGEYAVGKVKDQPVTPEMIKLIRTQYRDTFLAAVTHPKLCREPAGAPGEIPVDHLMTDWGLATELYAQITLYSHGKKKLKRASFLAPNF